MNELPPSDENKGVNVQDAVGSPESAPFVAPLPAATMNKPGRATHPLIYVVLTALALLLLAQWWYSQAQVAELRQEMAQRLRTGDSMNAETKSLVKAVQDSAKELQAKVSVLENKQVEAQSQQLALEQLYQDLSRSRDDWALAEIEQVLSTASQQLQLAGNVQGALIALQNADARLSRADQPQFISIRRALAKDMERLRALPVVDLTGIALRLDSIIDQVDEMPLLSDEKPVLPPTQPKPSRQASSEGAGAAGTEGAAPSAMAAWLAQLEEKWHSWTNEMWGEIRQLIHVRNVETPDALLLSPTQAFYARENLKLRLLNARLALVTRNEAAFRSDLLAAQDAVSRFFDVRAKQTQTVQTLLRQVQASDLSIEMPTLAESLNAVRNYKAKP